MLKIEEVKKFWEDYPLFSGESEFEVGSREFFKEHTRIYIEDVFAGNFRKALFIPQNLTKDAKILDLGCGIGFWTVELQLIGKFKNIYAADLTQNALNLTKKRLNFYELKADLSIQNAEKMTYEDDFFSHINCQGMIHHTPDAEAAIREIARVLKKGGTAYISVYYKNIFLKIWPKIFILGRALHKFRCGLKGRGRESIFLSRNPNEIVRLFDGNRNPIGKSFAKAEIVKMVKPYFCVEKIFLNFFPARAFSFKIPKFLHRFLSDNFGFLIHLNLRKK